MSGENSQSKRKEVRDKISKSKTGKKCDFNLGDKNPAKRIDVRKKISESKKGVKLLKHSNELHHKAKSVICINTGIVFLTLKNAAEWISLEREKKAHYNGIYLCCNNKAKTAYGYKWEYA